MGDQCVIRLGQHGREEKRGQWTWSDDDHWIKSKTAFRGGGGRGSSSSCSRWRLGLGCCFCQFLCNMILDGIAYIFGVLLTPLTRHFETDKGTVSWVGSLLCGMYMLSGPVVGGLVNRFGC